LKFSAFAIVSGRWQGMCFEGGRLRPAYPPPKEELVVLTRKLHWKKWPVGTTLTGFMFFTTLAGAQSVPTQNNPTQNPTQNSPQSTDKPAQRQDDRDASRRELSNFNQFLDDHHELSEQLRKNPSLVNDPQFVKDHPDLQTYLQEHPGVRQQLQSDPNAFMREENRYDRRADNRDPEASRRELANFNQFLDGHHRETAEQLRKDPSLVDNPQFVKNHPELQTYLQSHPEVRQDLRNNPNAFMHQEDRYENGVARDDRDANRRELANFNDFLDHHRETAEQLRKDPSLADNPQFMKEHPALQSYLQDHPAVRQEIKQDPNAFMQEEARYERRDNQMNGGDVYAMNGERDGARTHAGSFGHFLGTHAEISADVAKDPQLCKDPDYLQKHPELQSYLSAHPEVQRDLNNNPQDFVKSAQNFNNANGMTNTMKTGTTGTATPNPAPTDTKTPKQ
jgi:hypothetical protein